MIDNRCIGTVCKAMPSGFAPAGEDELWALATVEVPDREGDIVRIKGIDLSAHRAEMPIKVMGLGHNYKAEDPNNLPITGIVKEFRPTTTVVKRYGEVPALAFRMEFDREGEALTKYSRRMKSLYKGDSKKGLSPKLDAFSIGFDPRKVAQLKGGRYDVQECAIFEISPCIIPANPHAVVLKALREEFGEEIDLLPLLEERLLAAQQEMFAALTKAINTRFDDFESAAADRAENGPMPVSRRAGQLAKLNRAYRDGK